MKQIIATLTLVTVIVGLITIVIIGSNKKDSQVAEVKSKATEEIRTIDEHDADILYWGTTCPHCHDTIEWIEKNNIEEKTAIIRKEVYENQINSYDLSAKAKSCDLDEMNIGVPFMYTSQGECLIGTTDITQYLEQKISQNTTQVQDASDSAQTQGGEQK